MRIISGLLFGAIASFLLSKEIHTSRSGLFNGEIDDEEGGEYYVWNDEVDEEHGEGLDPDMDARTDADAGAYGEYFDMSQKDKIQSNLSYRSSRAASSADSNLSAGSRTSSNGSLRGSGSGSFSSFRPPSRTPSGSILRRISSRVPFSSEPGEVTEADWEEGHANGASDRSDRAGSAGGEGDSTDADRHGASPNRRGNGHSGHGHHGHGHGHGHGPRRSDSDERRTGSWMRWLLNPFGNRPGSEYTEIN